MKCKKEMIKQINYANNLLVSNPAGIKLQLSNIEELLLDIRELLIKQKSKK